MERTDPSQKTQAVTSQQVENQVVTPADQVASKVSSAVKKPFSILESLRKVGSLVGRAIMWLPCLIGSGLKRIWAAFANRSGKDSSSKQTGSPNEGTVSRTEEDPTALNVLRGKKVINLCAEPGRNKAEIKKLIELGISRDTRRIAFAAEVERVRISGDFELLEALLSNEIVPHWRQEAIVVGIEKEAVSFVMSVPVGEKENKINNATITWMHSYIAKYPQLLSKLWDHLTPDQQLDGAIACKDLEKVTELLKKEPNPLKTSNINAAIIKLSDQKPSDTESLSILLLLLNKNPGKAATDKALEFLTQVDTLTDQHIACIKKIIEKPISEGVCEKALTKMAQHGNLEIVKALLEKYKQIPGKNAARENTLRAAVSTAAKGSDRWNIRKALVVEGRKIETQKVDELEQLKQEYLVLVEAKKSAKGKEDLDKISAQIEELAQTAEDFRKHWNFPLVYGQSFFLEAEVDHSIHFFRNFLDIELESFQGGTNEDLKLFAEIAARQNYSDILERLLKQVDPAELVKFIYQLLLKLLAKEDYILKRSYSDEEKNNGKGLKIISKNLADISILLINKIEGRVPGLDRAEIINHVVSKHITKRNQVPSIYTEEDQNRILEALVPKTLVGEPLAALSTTLRSIHTNPDVSYDKLLQKLLSKHSVFDRLNLIASVENANGEVLYKSDIIKAVIGGFTTRELDEAIQLSKNNEKIKGLFIEFLKEKIRNTHLDSTTNLREDLVRIFELGGEASTGAIIDALNTEKQGHFPIPAIMVQLGRTLSTNTPPATTKSLYEFLLKKFPQKRS